MSTTDDLPLEDDQEQTEETPPTPEERIATLEKENARFRAFQPIVDQLEADPTKILDVRSALAGGGAIPTPATPAPNENLNPEQLKALNTQVTDMILEGRGLDAVALVSDKIAENRLTALQKQNEPLLDAQAESFIDKFCQRKGKDMDERLWGAVTESFDKDLTEIEKRKMMTQPVAERTKDLDRRWNAAAGQVLLSRVKPAASRAAAGGRGTGNMGNVRSQGVQKLDDRVMGIVKRAGLSDKEIAELEAELAEGA